MIEEFKTWRRIDKIVFCVNAVALVASICLLCFSCKRGTGGTDVDATIQAISQQQSGVNTEIRNAGNGVRDAEQTIAGARDELGTVQARLEQNEQAARRNAEQISECVKLAENCRSLAEANAAILAGVAVAGGK